MSPGWARRAFEPFFSTKGQGKGPGLGLSRVYAMARQSGGTVRLDTHPGQGTTVCLFLRRAEREVEEDLVAASAGTDGQSASGSIVLVIDDDDVVRRSLVATVESLGHRVDRKS